MGSDSSPLSNDRSNQVCLSSFLLNGQSDVKNLCFFTPICLWSNKNKQKEIYSPLSGLDQIGGPLGINEQPVHLQSTAHRAERATSMSALHKQSGHGPALSLAQLSRGSADRSHAEQNQSRSVRGAQTDKLTLFTIKFSPPTQLYWLN